MAVERALKGSESANLELNVLLTDDAALRDLNKRYRNIDKPTDVLSFPMSTDFGIDEDILGDIAISLDRARAQAKDYGATLVEELSRLAVHGTLHLLGYDHVNGGHQARKMKEREEAVLSSLKDDGVL